MSAGVEQKPLRGEFAQAAAGGYAALAARPFPRTGSRTATLYAPHFLAGRDSATTLYLLSVQRQSRDVPLEQSRDVPLVRPIGEGGTLCGM